MKSAVVAPPSVVSMVECLVGRPALDIELPIASSSRGVYPRRAVQQEASVDVVEADSEGQASRLAEALDGGELRLTTSSIKARALAWCARISMDRQDREPAKRLVKAAGLLERVDEVLIAEAFERFHDGDLPGALTTLSTNNSPASRSAAFIIVRKGKGPEQALLWLRQAGLTPKDLDSDGKFFVMAAQLDARQLDESLETSTLLSPEDIEVTPALLHLAASSNLVSVVPAELVSSVLSQPAATLVPVALADGVSAMAKRREAMKLYRRASHVMNVLGYSGAALEASDRALLLALWDPDERQAALTELRESLRSPDIAVRRLPIALEAEVEVDLDVADQEVDRQTTLSGGGTEHTALARLAIARQKPAGERAAYLQRHRDELVRRLNPTFVIAIEIAALIAANQLPVAEERLQDALQNGLSPEERDRLQHMVADARESDPSSARERRFLETDQLGDLMLLIGALESAKDWARISRFGALLFERLRDSSSCIVYAQSLLRLGEFTQVIEFLGKHEDLVAASDRLQSFLAWALYSVGDVTRCRTVLSQLRSIRDDAQDRDLMVNLEIASGNWNALTAFVEQEWERRDARDARSLLRAGMLAYSLGSGRARALITEAAEKAPDDPHVLVGCYSAAIGGGWEDEATFRWLERAAALSGPEGPVQKVSLKDLVDRNPGWQQRETQAGDQLTRGLIPIVGFGKILNRSLAEVSLLPAVGNGDAADPRRRTPIYAYSGARQPSTGLPQSAAVDPLALLNLELLGLLDKFCDTVGKVVIPHGTLIWLFEEAQKIRVGQPRRVADAHELKRLLSIQAVQSVEATAAVDEKLAREVGRDLASLFAEAGADWGTDQRPRYVIRPQPIHRLASLMEEEATLGSHAT
ncbi:MAG: hypothetical protein M3541_01915, partial [Acidobacteriota bacterium]|nr:hypothetical protein [Acidobacteriota bacterium]